MNPPAADTITISHSNDARRLGFWSALLTALFAAAHFAAGILTPPRSGPFAPPADVVPYPYTNAAAFIPGDYLWLLPGILLALIFVALIASIHQYASADKKVFGLIALCFALIYATVMIVNYLIQWMVVVPSLLSGETEGLGLFTQYNPHGVFIALEGIGYLMMSAALVSAAAVMWRGRLEGVIRWLFVTDFVLAVFSLGGLAVLRSDIVAFEVTILTVNWIALIVTGVMLAVLFRGAASGFPCALNRRRK